MGTTKEEDNNANNNAKDTKAESGAADKPSSGGWSKLKSSTKAASSSDDSTRDNKPLIQAPAAEEKNEPAPSKPKSAGWSRLKGATNKTNEAKTEETKPLKEEPTNAVATPPPPTTGPSSTVTGAINARARWMKSRELLGIRSNGSVKPMLNRTNSLVVPGQTRRPSMAFSEGRDSLHSRSDGTGSRRGSSLRFSAIDLSKLAAAQAAQEDEEEEDKAKATQSETYIQLAIPYLPMWLAAICLVMNVLIPGTGTILSGFSIFCFGKVRIESKAEDHKSSVLCTNLFVGCAQMFTVTFMLVGWFWSLTWGIYMIILAIERKKDLKKKREAKLQAMALTAFNPQVRPWTLSRNS